MNDLSSHNSGNGVDYKGEANAYLARMNTLAEELESDCRLFYMSVNPVNTAMKPTRKEAQLRYFNDRLQSRLNKRFQWIDTYKYLMKNGYSTYNEFKGNIDDGVHYSTRTYKRIYKLLYEMRSDKCFLIYTQIIILFQVSSISRS